MYENPAVLDSATILLFLAKIIKTNKFGGGSHIKTYRDVSF